MEGLLALTVIALLGAFCIRWTASRLRLPVPGRGVVLVVFVLVTLLLWGRYLNGG